MAELEQSIISLRPHHVKAVFFSWPLFTGQAILEKHLREGYSYMHIENMLNVYTRVIKQNSPFIIVPALDDICIACNFNPGNALGCSRPLDIDVMFQNDFAMLYGFKQSEPYQPSEFIAKIIKRGICLRDMTLSHYLLIQKKLKNNGGKLK
ncbi:MAG: hypothetical protein V1734_00225 [Nanoarchaeota archaeon]